MPDYLKMVGPNLIKHLQAIYMDDAAAKTPEEYAIFNPDIPAVKGEDGKAISFSDALNRLHAKAAEKMEVVKGPGARGPGDIFYDDIVKKLAALAKYYHTTDLSNVGGKKITDREYARFIEMITGGKKEGPENLGDLMGRLAYYITAHTVGAAGRFSRKEPAYQTSEESLMKVGIYSFDEGEYLQVIPMWRAGTLNMPTLAEVVDSYEVSLMSMAANAFKQLVESKGLCTAVRVDPGELPSSQC